MTDAGQPQAFVLMPFEPEFDSLFSRLIKPALEDAGYRCERADSVMDQRNVMHDVIAGIGNAHLVVAELTGRNANVLYEVGLAHGLRIPTVLLAQSIDDVPFDLRAYRIQLYSTRFDEIDELKLSLEGIAKAHIAGEVQFGNPVVDFLDGDGAAPRRPSNELEGDDTVDAAGESGFLDWLADWDEATERIGDIGAEIGHATTDMGEDLERHNEKLTKLHGSTSPGTAVQARRIASMAASDLTRYAERLESALPDFERTVRMMIEGGIGYLAWVEIDNEDDRSGIEEAGGALDGMLAATQGALGSVREMRDAMRAMTGASVELDRSVRRTVKALDQVIGLLEQTESFCDRAAALVAEKVEAYERERA